MLPVEFTPKLLTVIRERIAPKQFIRDLLSGLIVGIVALPLAIAFAIASGVSPEKGLITAIIAGFIISAFGGSRVQIGGPTGAFIVIVYGIVQNHGVEGLTIATFIAGFLLLLMGFLRFGRLLRYFPITIIAGFTTGIAVIIFSSQIKDLLGLEMGDVPSGFIDKWIAYAGNLGKINAWAIAIGLGTVLITFFMPKVSEKIPGSLLAIVLSTWAVVQFQLPVDTIESRFGQIPSTLPVPRFYFVDFETLKQLLQPALAIALLGGIESLLSAVVADGMIGSRHRSNMELVAQGGANIASAMFGGIPATGAIARTATNVKNGGRTPVAGIIHALTLLLIMVAAAPLAGKIPLACLAGILTIVAWNMSELHLFRSILRSNRYDALVLLTTFALTVIFDLVIAIEIGMVMAAFLFVKRMSDTAEMENILVGSKENGKADTYEAFLGKIPPEVGIFEIKGPLFFGATQKFLETLRVVDQHYKQMILWMKNVPMIDATGLQRLKEIVKSLEKQHIQVWIAEASPEVKAQISKAQFIEQSRFIDNLEAHLEELTGEQHDP